MSSRIGSIENRCQLSYQFCSKNSWEKEINPIRPGKICTSDGENEW